MHFISVTIKRSRLNGGNVCYSVLSSNILRKHNVAKTTHNERVSKALRAVPVPIRDMHDMFA